MRQPSTGFIRIRENFSTTIRTYGFVSCDERPVSGIALERKTGKRDDRGYAFISTLDNPVNDADGKHQLKHNTELTTIYIGIYTGMIRTVAPLCLDECNCLPVRTLSKGTPVTANKTITFSLLSSICSNSTLMLYHEGRPIKGTIRFSTEFPAKSKKHRYAALH